MNTRVTAELCNKIDSMGLKDYEAAQANHVIQLIESNKLKKMIKQGITFQAMSSSVSNLVAGHTFSEQNEAYCSFFGGQTYRKVMSDEEFSRR
ncbi:hypothetical protein [Vibrio coralliilyticus]|uniref:Uncharacterized protein n=1 Tax=Vibrio coralliilyticus TaxID=190893 RepID=A0AAP6ZQH4_9VIBR|nr:hypothetical protein [Vibrio coralliilyticus]NOJ26341.1 hypothetical protein [Vibrio coralliilyticus]